MPRGDAQSYAYIQSFTGVPPFMNSVLSMILVINQLDVNQIKLQVDFMEKCDYKIY